MLFELSITAVPLDVSAMLGVDQGSSQRVRCWNRGPDSVQRQVATSVPTDPNLASWVYGVGESWVMNVAGGVDGSTYLSCGGSSVVILEDTAPS